MKFPRSCAKVPLLLVSKLNEILSFSSDWFALKFAIASEISVENKQIKGLSSKLEIERVVEKLMLKHRRQGR